MVEETHGAYGEASTKVRKKLIAKRIGKLCLRNSASDVQRASMEKN